MNGGTLDLTFYWWSVYDMLIAIDAKDNEKTSTTGHLSANLELIKRKFKLTDEQIELISFEEFTKLFDAIEKANVDFNNSTNLTQTLENEELETIVEKEEYPF